MRELLTRWAILEPNKVPPSILANITDCNSEVMMMRIQWAVQQAIIEKGWWLEVSYTPSSGYSATITLPRNKARKFSDNSMAEVLLAAYLEVLEQ